MRIELITTEPVGPKGSSLAAEETGPFQGVIDLLHNPKYSIIIFTIAVAFIMLLLYILNIVPWGTGRQCWAQC